ncbi:MAG: GTPase [Acidimicrobiaceae bacterium]
MTLAEEVVAGDRRALARAITLVESTRDDHRTEAIALLNELLPHTGGSSRVGISGAPGAGKSTLIDALGGRLVDGGHEVAVLAVDPSSARSGGSVLGDKTRMDTLARSPQAYIRPSPSGGTLGGIARRTGESLLVCEAAGFDVVVVETVGVGQSETEVDGIVDVFVLLVSPGGGDELQGIKRGITELADIVVVTKADGDLLPSARNVAAEYQRALMLLRRHHDEWEPTVVMASGITGEGVAELAEAIDRHRAALDATGALARRRAEQATRALWAELQDRLLARFRDDTDLQARARALEAEVAAGRLAPAAAAAALLSS